MRERISLPIAAGLLLLGLAAVGSVSRAGEPDAGSRDTTLAARGESTLAQRMLTGRLALLLRIAEAATPDPGEPTDNPGFSTNGIYDDPDPAGISNGDRRRPPPKPDATVSRERGKRRPAGSPVMGISPGKKTEQR